MSLLEEVDFAIRSYGKTLNLINSWNPPFLDSEKAYERSLLNHLNHHLKSVSVVAQYGFQRCDVDLCVGDTILIEIKKDLTVMGEFQRLLGQLFLLGKWSGQILVIIIGECDPHFEKELKSFTHDLDRKFFSSSALAHTDFITVIRK